MTRSDQPQPPVRLAHRPEKARNGHRGALAIFLSRVVNHSLPARPGMFPTAGPVNAELTRVAATRPRRPPAGRWLPPRRTYSVLPAVMVIQTDGLDD